MSYAIRLLVALAPLLGAISPTRAVAAAFGASAWNAPGGGGGGGFGGGGGGLGGLATLGGLGGLAVALDNERDDWQPAIPISPDCCLPDQTLELLGQSTNIPTLPTIPLMDNTVVSSIGHYFGPAFSFPGDPNPGNIVIDFLINQTQETGGGATLPDAHKDLDLFSAVYHRIQAPIGKSFHVDFPEDATETTMSAYMVWTTGQSDSGGSRAFAQNYENLIGPVPASANHSAVGAGNQFFTLTPDVQGVSDMQFSAVTFATAYEPRTLGLGPLTYHPTGFGQPLGTSRADAYYLFAYHTSAATDPGRFISFVTTPPRIYGDYDGNGVVTGNDLLEFQRQLGQQPSVDFNSGRSFAATTTTDLVNQDDLSVWLRHVFPTPPPSTAIPEPGSLALLISGATTLALTRAHGRLRPFPAKRPSPNMHVGNFRQPGAMLTEVGRCEHAEHANTPPHRVTA